MKIIKLQKEKLIIDPDNPDLCQEVKRFLSGSDIQFENIPVTIIVKPPISTVIEDANRLSEILIELSVAYRTEGNYLLKLYISNKCIIVTFYIEHSASTFSNEIGHC